MAGKAHGMHTAVKSLRREGSSGGVLGAAWMGLPGSGEGKSLISEGAKRGTTWENRELPKKEQNMESLGKIGNCRRIKAWRSSCIGLGW